MVVFPHGFSLNTCFLLLLRLFAGVCNAVVTDPTGDGEDWLVWLC